MYMPVCVRVCVFVVIVLVCEGECLQERLQVQALLVMRSVTVTGCTQARTLV